MKNSILMMISWVAIGFSAVAQETFPLLLDIDVSTKRTHDELAAVNENKDDVRFEWARVNVDISRKVGDVPKGKLAFEFYVIGRDPRSGDYGVIDVVKEAFELKESNDYRFSFSSPTYSIGEPIDVTNIADVYETYLVVVADASGKMLAYRCGWAVTDKDVSFIRKLGLKTRFDEKRTVVGELELPEPELQTSAPDAAVQEGVEE